MTVLDSKFQAVDSVFQVLNSGPFVSGSNRLQFRVPLSSIPECISKTFPRWWISQAKTSLIPDSLRRGERTAPVYNLLLGVPYDVPLYKTSYLLQQPIFNFSFINIKFLSMFFFPSCSVHFNSFSIPLSTFKTVAGIGLQLQISDASASLSGNWHYRKDHW